MPKPHINKSDKEILLNGMPVYFCATESCYLEPHDVEIVETSCGFEFKVNSFSPITMVIPSKGREILIGDDFKSLHTDRIRKFYFKAATSLLDGKNAEISHAPIFHMIGENAWSVSVSGETVICTFKKFYEQYISIIGIPDQRNNVYFYLDVAKNWRSNLQRHSIPRRTLQYTNTLEPSEILEAIYYGAILRKTQPIFDLLQQEAKRVQGIFNSHDLYSVIIGSMAEMLNGIECSVTDVDFMFKDRPSMVYAAEILKERDFAKIKENEKLIKMQSKKTCVDLTFDNYNLLYNPFNVRETQGLRFFDVQGLMWLCLLNEYESTYNNNNYLRNKKALYEISKYCSEHKMPCNTKLEYLWHNDLYKSKNCAKICDILNRMETNFDDIKINAPFKVNSFTKDQDHAYAVVNLGEETDCRIITPLHDETAIWFDVNGDSKPVNIEKHNEFTMLFIDGVNAPGIVLSTERGISDDSFRQEYQI